MPNIHDFIVLVNHIQPESATGADLAYPLEPV